MTMRNKGSRRGFGCKRESKMGGEAGVHTKLNRTHTGIYMEKQWGQLSPG